ncbi:MAG: hypothetical protein HYU80_00540 [Candidatus Blackburnbacteria bacterium]|nr:hypothetical protein [Candidatus Blackburnbacteria bacterium]
MLSLILRHKTLFAFLLFSFLFAPLSIAKAQYSLDAHQKAISNPGQSNQKFNQGTFAGFVNSANTTLLGCGDKSGCPNDLKVGALNITGEMIATLYANPPASGLAYTQDIIHRFNPIQPAYAQTAGTGFRALEALLPLWRTFRNFAYVAFTIVFIAIGLAIMFRMKLDPRTVITIQSAIPRIIIGLLLVTFSYAIAGFMIDLLYIALSLVVLLFVGNNPAATATADLQNQFTTGGFGVAWSHLWGIIGGGATAITLSLTAVVGIIGGAFLGLLNPVAGTAAILVGGGAGIILLVLLVLILYILFKLFTELLTAYIGILLAVILGPLQIALGVIPGLPGFGAWIKGIAANLSIFVAVAFILLLGGAITKVAGGNLWSPPLLAGGGIIASALPLLIGIGILLIVHQVPGAVRNAFGIRGLGFAVGQAVGTTITQPASGYMEARSRRATGATASGLWSAGSRILGGIGGGRR